MRWARVARFLGHEVITDNHIGDWGTQFGMVIWAWKKELNRTALEGDPLTELLRLYRLASSPEQGGGRDSRRVPAGTRRLAAGERREP